MSDALLLQQACEMGDLERVRGLLANESVFANLRVGPTSYHRCVVAGGPVGIENLLSWVEWMWSKVSGGTGWL